MLYDTQKLTKEEYNKECAKLLIAFENSTYKQENTIHIAKNVTIGYGLDLLKCDGAPKNFLLDYLPDDSKKLKIGNEEFTFYEIIENYRANQQGFTDHNTIKNYLQNEVFDFSLTQEQAQKILENMIPIYEKRLSPITTHYLPYSKERASLLSIRYLGKAIENNGLVKAIKANSRFLAWFIIRYKTNINTYLGYIARSCDEADIYLSNPSINKHALIFDIFSHLNIIKQTIKYRIYKDKDNIKNYREKNKEDILLNLTQWYENDLDFIKFNTKNQVIKISKSNISSIYSNLTKNYVNDIITTLSPHLNYINQIFAKGSISAFDLANIYVLNEIKDCEKLNVALYQRSQNNTNDSNTAKNTSNQSTQNTPNSNATPSQQPQENILIICLSPKMQPQNTDTYEIKQQDNTFITIAVFEGAKIDFASLDSKNSEILLAKITAQSNTNKEIIEVFPLQGSNQAMKQQSNTLTTKGSYNETYIFEANSKADSKENAISPILKVYANKEADTNKYIEIHNFAKHTLKSNHTLESSESNSTQNKNNNAQSPQDDISYLLSKAQDNLSGLFLINFSKILYKSCCLI